MGTSLTGLQIGSSYSGLLKTTDNAVLDAVLRTITDGAGNDSALQVSTAGVKSLGTFTVAGAASLPICTAIGSTTPGTGAFTSLSASAGLNADSIGLSSPGTGAFTTLSATDSISSQRAFISSGFITTNGANRATLDVDGSNRARVLGWGPDAATPGTLDLGVLSSDASVTALNVARVSSTGLAVTGVLSATGVLTLGSGATTVSDAAGKILSAALNTVAVANGGTGSTSASDARTALGLAIGTNVQAYNANLTTFAGIAPSANVQTLLGAADYAAVRTQLGLTVGTDVQAYNANLAQLAALSDPNADRLLFWDDSAGAYTHLTLGSNLSISGTTINAASGGGGTLGGSTGGTDNRILRADGTGGSTVQASGVTIDDSDNVTGAATYDAGTGGYKVSGTKVLGAQASAIPDITLDTSLTGSDSVNITDLSANFGLLNGKINTILAALRAHGIIAT